MFKIAAFEMDVMIKISFLAANNKYISKDVAQLKKLSDNGYKIVIFGYQENIDNIEIKNRIIRQVENIPELIKIPVQVFVATQNDIYKQPAPGIWNILVSDVRLLFFMLLNKSYLYTYYYFSSMEVYQLTWRRVFFVVALERGLFVLILMTVYL